MLAITWRAFVAHALTSSGKGGEDHAPARSLAAPELPEHATRVRATCTSRARASGLVLMLVIVILHLARE